MQDETVRVVPMQWAVVQTGYITPDSDVVRFALEDGTRVPQIVKLFPNEATARKSYKRLAVRHGRVSAVAMTNSVVCQPIYGVAETDLPAPRRATTATTEAGTTTEAPKPKRGRK